MNVSIRNRTHFKKAGLALCAATLLVGSMQVASADVVLPPGSIWEYTFTDPTANANWNTTTGGWTTGPAPFGSVSDGDFGYSSGTLWPADSTGTLTDDLWVRTTIDLECYDLSTILYALGVDNGFKLFVNGTQVAADNAEFYTSRWEYSGPIPAGALVSGKNVIALALEDHGGSTAFDMQITGRIDPNCVPGVPDGGLTFAMLGMGLFTLRASRRLLK